MCFGFNIYENFFLPQNVQTGSGVHPASYSNGEVNHSPPTSAKVKNEWSYTSTSPIWVHGMDKENFSFI